MLFGIKKGMTAIFKNEKRYPVTCILIPQHLIIKEVKDTNRLLVGIPGKNNYQQNKMCENMSIPWCGEMMEVESSYKEFLTSPKFKEGQFLDIRGKSKGKGFQGVMKRWGFKGQPASHGNSKTHRHMGSTGQNTTPSKVFKGKKMPGNMGNDLVWQCNLQVVEYSQNYLFVKGSIPGADNAIMLIKDSYQRNGLIKKFQSNPVLQ
eukprot:NODE_612_length_5407_cov_0.901093.p3 type:complete len:205 gc:universal NODE_612_length_5407_cov_0.901093:2301-2915(+)